MIETAQDKGPASQGVSSEALGHIKRPHSRPGLDLQGDWLREMPTLRHGAGAVHHEQSPGIPLKL